MASTTAGRSRRNEKYFCGKHAVQSGCISICSARTPSSIHWSAAIRFKSIAGCSPTFAKACGYARKRFATSTPTTKWQREMPGPIPTSNFLGRLPNLSLIVPTAVETIPSTSERHPPWSNPTAECPGSNKKIGRQSATVMDKIMFVRLVNSPSASDFFLCN